MRNVHKKLELEQLERRDCPAVGVGGLPPVVSNDLAQLTRDLNKAAVDFQTPPHTLGQVLTDAADAGAIARDTAKLALDVRAQTHASVGGMLRPLISLELDEATLYFDMATGNKAGAQNAAVNELNDLQNLGTALQGTNPTLATNAFGQAFTAFQNANDTLFGTGGPGIIPA
jgi:hypothetical protein